MYPPCLHLCIHFMCWSEKSGDGAETCIHSVSTYEYSYHAVTDGDTMSDSGNKQEMRFLFISTRTTGTGNNWKYSGNVFPLYFLCAITPPSASRYCVWDWLGLVGANPQNFHKCIRVGSDPPAHRSPHARRRQDGGAQVTLAEHGTEKYQIAVHRWAFSFYQKSITGIQILPIRMGCSTDKLGSRQSIVADNQAPRWQNR